MTVFQIVALAIIQGLAELLPVSSSAHVIVAAKLMRIDPRTPQFTLLLVMLHTGTMFAVILYFWKRWELAFFGSQRRVVEAAKAIIIATFITGVVGGVLVLGIQHVIKHNNPDINKAEVENLFSHLELIALALAAAGILILVSGLAKARHGNRSEITNRDAAGIGAIQGLCLPFRGFSRSGATISTGLLLGISRVTAEDYSFALAVVLTPVVVLWEARRLIHHTAETSGVPIGMHDFLPGLIGMVASFMAGLLALAILSKVLEAGRWWLFGVYCLAASVVVFGLYHAGY